MVARRIRFLLDDDEVCISDCDPNRTVLQYLREDLGRTGTKEGCAEGDCGACTCVLGVLDGDRIQFRAINSCIQFLPTLHGTALYTVESLKAPGGALHPVQQALVQCHASQCGFCTPGFVMSLFALYKSVTRPSRRDINDALAGNLCRCTGYRPIVDAAFAMYDVHPDGSWLQTAGPEPGNAEASAGMLRCVEQLRALSGNGALEIAGSSDCGVSRKYLAPDTLEALAEAVAAHPDACLLAGGTDVGLWVTKQHRDLDMLIYLGAVEALRTIEVSDDMVDFGAGVTLSDAQGVVDRYFPALNELLRRFASPPIRNAATLCGNIANGSPIGDLMPALLALDATLVLRHGASHREIPLRLFYHGYRKTDLGPGEFIERVRIPKLPRDGLFRVYKISKRFDQDISAVCGAFLLQLKHGRISHARVGFGGMAAIPQRAAACEAALLGNAWDEETLAAARRALDQDFTPIDDMRASADYRQRVARNLLQRFYLESTGFSGATRVSAAGTGT